MKKVLVVVGLALISLMFLVGYLIGTRNKTDSVTDNVLRTTAPKIISKLQGNPQNLETLYCSDKNICVGETTVPPYQWLRYAQYYYAKAFNQTIPTDEILSDLFLYTDNTFYQKFYQYGDIILDSGITDTKYKDKYLELFDKSLDSSYFSLEGKYNYYSQTSPIGEEMLQGSQIVKGRNNGVWVMDYSTSAVNAADAYLMTKDPKYLSAINNLLNPISLIYYFDGIPTKAMENPPKYSACYSLLATVKAFSVTQDKQYLQLTKDMLLGQNNYLQQFYSLAPSQMELFSSNPMNVLPCLDALNLLKVYDTGNRSVYISTYDTIMDFLIKNKIIDSSKGSDSFGMMLVGNKLDVNSTAWLIKILSENIINNGK